MIDSRSDLFARTLRAHRSRRAVLTSVAGALPALAVAPLAAAPRRAARPSSVPARGSSADLEAPADGLLDVDGGRLLHLYGTGSGGPTVILEQGYGDAWTEWRLVQPVVSRVARVYSYDRANNGESDTVPGPRTAADAVRDLHALIQAAALPTPVVLVGHSYGGLTARLFASTYPDLVAGLVLVEAIHEEYFDRLWRIEPEQTDALLAALASIPENVDFAASADQVREAGPLPAMPAAVIARGQLGFPPFEPTEATEQLWQDLQRDLVGLLPDAEFLVAQRSGHSVPKEQPEAVVEATLRVVEAVKEAGL